MANALSEAADEVMKAHLPPGIRIRMALYSSMQRMFFVLAYKALLLGNWVRRKTDHEQVIVGYPELTEVRSFGLNIGRFDNLFLGLALEARDSLPSSVRLIAHAYRTDGERQLSDMGHVGRSLRERGFLALNLPSSVVLSKLSSKGFRLRTGDRRQGGNPLDVVVIRECELIDETVAYLRKRGCRVGYDRLGWMRNMHLERGRIDRGKSDFTEWFLKVGRSLFERRGVPYECFQDAALRILVGRVYDALEFAGPLTEKIMDVVGRKGERTVFLTNGLTLPTERLFYQCCRVLGKVVFGFEHGVTAGLSQLSAVQCAHAGIRESDRMVCFSDSSARQYVKDGDSNGHRAVVGAPALLRRLRFKRFQRLLSRLVYGMRIRGRIILYATLVSQNNTVYGPFGQNDHFYFEITKKVIFDILARTRDLCIIKLYPSYRYIDPDPFGTIVEFPPNVKALQFVELRYLRSLYDVVICDSPQSTLGWVWSSGVPLIFLDLPSNPLLPEIAGAFDNAIFRVDCSKEGWEDEVRKLLSLPHWKLVEEWRQKEPIRKRIEREVLFGPPGISGQKAAEYVLEESSRWYRGKQRNLYKEGAQDNGA
ncbi:MAG: hypothetical protein AB1512_05975 [Thermodesulfobacteriota bacterium]